MGTKNSEQKKKKAGHRSPRRHTMDKIRFSIGAKLITIISIIVLVSLGSITILVSWLIRDDLKTSAEENNLEVNRRSAREADYTLANMRSNSLLLIQAITALGVESADAKEAVDVFFTENPQAAALVFTTAGQSSPPLINKSFFLTHEIDIPLADSFLETQGEVLKLAAAGEPALLNAAPYFKMNVSLLAMFFPWQKGGVGVLFSPENLDESFGSGLNQSFLINNSGDILVHTDSELTRNNVNVSNQRFIQDVQKNPERNAQTKYTDEKGISYYGAFTKLETSACTVITNIQERKIFEGIEATTRRNIYLTVAVLFISIMFIWFFSKSISIPLKALAAATRKIEGGAFETDLQPRGRDEISILTAGFQRMCTALGIFGRFTNKDIAVRAMRGEIKPGGLPRHATIFFSDIRSFTAKSEDFTKTFGNEASNRIVLWLNDYFTHMVDCVEKTGGVVDKFIGDAVMAHWGTAYTAGSPVKDAFNCVKAALMMRKALYGMNKIRKPGDPGDPPIHIGCGINTGIVTAGQIGSDLRMEYTAIGDPVNLASRAESLNKPLGTDILITEDTWQLVKDFFITEEMPSVTVKGKARPVRLFAVVNFAGITKGPKTLADVRILLDIEAPDISKVDLDKDEKKYKIGGKD
ncbi:MAG: HAMP domain-containing protein [Spirochaetaceae bacterium]|jgi:adenylate cyclase|nr:HAMP domain-containing protein [Spirochaetaceae bacterium]